MGWVTFEYSMDMCYVRIENAVGCRHDTVTEVSLAADEAPFILTGDTP